MLDGEHGADRIVAVIDRVAGRERNRGDHPGGRDQKQKACGERAVGTFGDVRGLRVAAADHGWGLRSGLRSGRCVAGGREGRDRQPRCCRAPSGAQPRPPPVVRAALGVARRRRLTFNFVCGRHEQIEFIEFIEYASK